MLKAVAEGTLVGHSAALLVGRHRPGADLRRGKVEKLKEKRRAQRAAVLNHASRRASLQGKVLREHLERLLRGLRGPLLAREEGLGPLAVDGRRRHAAIGDACRLDDHVLRELDAQAPGDDGDVVVAAPRCLVCLADLSLDVEGHEEALDDLIGAQVRLPVGPLLEEVTDSHLPDRPVRLRNVHGRTDGHEHRVEIRDGRGVCDVAAHAADIADLVTRKPLQLVHHRQAVVCLGLGHGLDARLHALLDARQRRRRAKGDACGSHLEDVELRNMRGAHQSLPARPPELALDLELRVPRHHLEGGVLRLELQQLAQRRGPEPCALAARQHQALRLKRRGHQPLRQSNLGLAAVRGHSAVGRGLGLVALAAEGLERVEDGAVARASAQVAVHGVLDVVLRRLRLVAEQRVHRHDEPGRAVPALRAVRVGEPGLHGVHSVVGLSDALNGEYMASVHGTHRGNARVDRLVNDLADVDVKVRHCHRARAASALTAPELGTCQALGPEPLQERHLGVHLPRQQ
mmetsp:Transcript_33589/g.65539  ORF Transcript_33589/g.65539 Transcript_33589/m.65539 type:complete len:516 (+) Transcript_33589:2877-4424(+)